MNRLPSSSVLQLTFSHSRVRRKQGTLLGAVLVLIIAIGVIVASLLRMSLTEQRISESADLYDESRYAVESILEYGMAQLQSRRRSGEVVTTAELLARPLRLPSETSNFQLFDTSRLVLPSSNNPTNSASALRSRPTALFAVILDENTVPTTIDAIVAGNEFDPMNGAEVNVREVILYAKATVVNARGRELTTYASQRFQILDESIFSYAIFYNDDMTLAPGANMDLVGGSVYSGGNMWLRSGATLNVDSRISSAGTFRIGREDDGSGFYNSGSGGNINIFSEIASRRLSLDTRDWSGSAYSDLGLNPEFSGYLETGRPNFRSLVEQLLGGRLLTAEHGVQQRTAVGLGDLDRVFDGAEPNPNYHIIQPPMNFNDLTDASLSTEQREILRAVEDAKIANQAGLHIELDTSSGTPEINVFTLERNATGGLVYDSVTGEPRRIEVSVPPSMQFVEAEVYAEEGDAAQTSGRVVSGLYDFREANNSDNATRGRKNLVRVDVERLREYLEADVNATDSDGNEIFASSTHPSTFYNGGVFISTPRESSGGSSPHFTPADRQWAVQLHNGTTVPNPSYLREPGRTPAYGMTLATNTALYVQGDFNNPHGSNSNTTPGNPSGSPFGETEGAEAAVALVADAVTLLSNNWSNERSRRPSGNWGSETDGRRPTDTVFSASIITGNVMDDRDYSGGVENFPRFLENWRGRTAYIRGNLVSLFQSEVQDQNWRFGGNVYTAPNRTWGYNSAFATYARPPLFPSLEETRRVYFSEITRDEFESGIGLFANMSGN